MSNILVTTTNSIEGYTIIKYYEMISERVVVGAGAFSEVFAAFTDVFGGRSTKFENRLAELNNDAMGLIKMSAKRLGANAVISTSIDIDEISGKGTQMFMITVCGTPVFIKKNLESSVLGKEEVEGINYRNIEEIVLSNKYLAELEKATTIENVNSIIDDLIMNNVILPLDAFLPLVNKFESQLSKLDNEKIEYGLSDVKINLYFSLYNSDDLTSQLNKYLLKCSNFGNMILEAYGRFAIPDYENILELVAIIPKHQWIKSIITVLNKYKSAYTASDVIILKKICEMLGNYEESSVEISKGMFKKEVWICSCGKKNSINADECDKCQRKKSGLTFYDNVKVESTISFLNQIADIVGPVNNGRDSV